MMIAMLIVAATPLASIPVEAEPLICKTVADHPLKSKRSVACGTAKEWQAFQEAYKAAMQKEQRKSHERSSAYAGVGSGY